MRPITIAGVAVVTLALVFGAGAIAATQFADGGDPVGGHAGNANLPELVQQAQGSVVSITALADLGQQAQAVGSGFIVDRDGHILTNYHVIVEIPNPSVQLADGTILPATVQGVDPANDLAVIHVDADPELLQPVTLGDSDAVLVGETVIAIGSPLGLAFTVTSGIVSAVDRDDLISPAQRPIVGAIQTDASINPGNSGGPLFNMNGEVIGINTAIRSPGLEPVFTGIGLAVPVNNAARHLDRMIAGETIRHPQLGIVSLPTTPQLAEALGLATDQGLYVLEVAPGSAADAAGIQGASPAVAPGELPRGGDVIVAFGGTEVEDLAHLRRLIDEYAPGDVVTVDLAQILHEGLRL